MENFTHLSTFVSLCYLEFTSLHVLANHGCCNGHIIILAKPVIVSGWRRPHLFIIIIFELIDVMNCIFIVMTISFKSSMKVYTEFVNHLQRRNISPLINTSY